MKRRLVEAEGNEQLGLADKPAIVMQRAAEYGERLKRLIEGIERREPLTASDLGRLKDIQQFLAELGGSDDEGGMESRRWLDSITAPAQTAGGTGYRAWLMESGSQLDRIKSELWKLRAERDRRRRSRPTSGKSFMAAITC